MAEVKIGFGSVIGYENFAMLKGAHGSRVDIKVGVEFFDENAIAGTFKEGGDAGGGGSFTEAGANSSKYKQIACFFHRLEK